MLSYRYPTGSSNFEYKEAAPVLSRSIHPDPARISTPFIAGATGVLLTLAIAARLYVGMFVMDDAYITFRYAQNIAHHWSFVYNAGERVLGTTTPLFAMVLAGVSALGVPLEGFSFGWAIACDAGVILLLVAALHQSGCSRGALCAAAFIATAPLGITFTASGMETAFYSLLVIAAIRAAAAALNGASPWPASVLLGLVCLCRPDGALVPVAVAVVAALRRRPRAVRLMWGAALVLLPWAAFALWYFGSPVPQSVRTKALLVTPDRLLSAKIVGAHFFHGVYPIVSAAALAGAVRLWRQHDVFWQTLAIWWGIYLSLFVAANAFAHAFWYLAPLMAAYFAFAAAGLDLVLRRWQPRYALVVCLAIVVVAARALPGHRRILAESWGFREARYLRIGHEIARSPFTCAVAATEIGALGYAYPGRIVDLAGLVTPSATRVPLDELLHNENAAWVVTHNIFLPAALRNSAWFAREFRLLRSEEISKGRTLDIWFRPGAQCGPKAGG